MGFRKVVLGNHPQHFAWLERGTAKPWTGVPNYGTTKNADFEDVLMSFDCLKVILGAFNMAFWWLVGGYINL